MSSTKTGEYLPAMTSAGFPQATNVGSSSSYDFHYCPNPENPWWPAPYPWNVYPAPWAQPYPVVTYQPPAVTVTFKAAEGELAMILKTLLEAVERKIIDQETLVKILQLVKDK